MARFDFIACYILANRRQGTLYTGYTSDLPQRLDQHKLGSSAFTAKWGCVRLVWYERYALLGDAFQKEKRLKKWKRQWKIDLIEASNPTWRDLGMEIW